MNKMVPKIRFNNFNDEWNNFLLKEIGDPYTSLSGKTKNDFGHGNAKYITYMNILSNPISDINLTELIEIDRNQNSVKRGDVFFTVSSETPEEVGMSSVWLGDEENVYLNSFCFGFRPKINIDNYYIAYVLRNQHFRKQMRLLAQGISRFNISKNRVMDLNIFVPQNDEQEKIGKIFKCIDRIIGDAEIKLNKLKEIKKTMIYKMFPQNGKKVPEIRLKGFKGDWEEKTIESISDNVSAGGDIEKSLLNNTGKYPVIGNALTKDGIMGYYENIYKIQAPAITVTARGNIGQAMARYENFTPVVRLLVIKTKHDASFIEKAINNIVIMSESSGIPQLTIPQLSKYKIQVPKDYNEEKAIGEYFNKYDNMIDECTQKILKMKELKKTLLDKMFV